MMKWKFIRLCFITNNYFVSLQLNQSFIADICWCSKLMIPNKIQQLNCRWNEVCSWKYRYEIKIFQNCVSNCVHPLFVKISRFLGIVFNASSVHVTISSNCTRCKVMQIVDDRTITIEILGKLPKNSCQFRYECRYILNGSLDPRKLLQVL